jgi:hypothetical protein
MALFPLLGRASREMVRLDPLQFLCSGAKIPLLADAGNYQQTID